MTRRGNVDIMCAVFVLLSFVALPAVALFRGMAVDRAVLAAPYPDPPTATQIEQTADLAAGHLADLKAQALAAIAEVDRLSSQSETQAAELAALRVRIAELEAEIARLEAIIEGGGIEPDPEPFVPVAYICTNEGDSTFIGTVSPTVMAQLAASGAEPLIMVYERLFIDRDPQAAGFTPGSAGGYAVDEARLVAALDALVPAAYDGAVMLDIEGSGGELLTWLRWSEQTPQFANAIAVLTEALTIAKRERPHAQVGLYASVILATWDGYHGPAWESCTEGQRAERIALAARPAAVHDACDYLSCSIYEGRPESTGAQQNAEGSALARARNAAEIDAAKLIAGDKPVVVTIRDRFNNLSLIPIDECGPISLPWCWMPARTRRGGAVCGGGGRQAAPPSSSPTSSGSWPAMPWRPTSTPGSLSMAAGTWSRSPPGRRSSHPRNRNRNRSQG